MNDVKLVALLFLLLFARANLAHSETFTGLLMPQTFDPPIPIIVDFEYLDGRLVGRVETASPFAGAAPIASGDKQGGTCKVRSEIRVGVILVLEGLCLPASFEGKYTIDSGGRDQQGTFSVSRLGPKQQMRERRASGVRRGGSFDDANAVCVRANSACLAACPPGDYNAKFMCSNRCRQRLASCRLSKSSEGGGSDRSPLNAR